MKMQEGLLENLKNSNGLKMNPNEDQFLLMLKKNRATIYKVAYLYTDNAEDRKDLVQEIIYQLLKSFDKFENRSKINTWLYRVALNTALYHLKKNKLRTALEPLNENYDVILDEEHGNSEMMHQMMQAIQSLGVIDRGIVLLYFEENSQSEIAEIMGMSVSNIGTRMQRIKQKLKGLMQKNISYGIG